MIKCCRPIPFFHERLSGRHTMPKVLRLMVIKQDLGEVGPILDTVSAEFLWLYILL